MEPHLGDRCGSLPRAATCLPLDLTRTSSHKALCYSTHAGEWLHAEEEEAEENEEDVTVRARKSEEGIGEQHGIAEPLHRSTLLRLYLLLATVGICTCSLSFLNVVIINFGHRVKGYVLKLAFEMAGGLGLGIAGTEAVAAVTYVGFGILTAGVAHICARIAPMSFGSGIPEIRCELQGTHLKRYFRRRLLLVRAASLSIAEAGGLSVGKEGPFVHMAAVISNMFLKTRLFKKLTVIPGIWHHMLCVSASIGTCSTFGVPIGGVLFALEVMPDAVWENTSYWSCLIAAVSGSLALRALPRLFDGPIVNLLPIIPDYKRDNNFFVELMLSITLGLICGLMGGFFVLSQIKVQTRLRAWMAGNQTPSRQRQERYPALRASRHEEAFLDDSDETLRRVSIAHRIHSVKSAMPGGGNAVVAAWRWRCLLLCLGVAALDSLVTFVIPLFRGTTQASLLWWLVSMKHTAWDVPKVSHMPHMHHDPWIGAPPALVVYFCCTVVKFVLMNLVLALPLPAGCIVPLYVVGALLGRTYAEVLKLIAGLVGWKLTASFHAELALVGATALTAAVCRSFSVVIAVFELVRNPAMMLPLSASAISAIHVANRLSPSIFEAMSAVKRLPAMPQARTLLEGLEPISTLMHSVPTIPGTCEGKEGRAFLRGLLEKHTDTIFAVVAGTVAADPMQLLGFAHRATVESLASDAVATAPGMITDALVFAPQVPPSMPIKRVLCILELYAAPAVFVTEGGCLRGVVSHDRLLHTRHDLYMKKL